MGTRRYSDADLAAAVTAARSWRGVLRALHMNDSSAGSLRAARRRATELGIDHGHFSGQRQWSDDQLPNAVERGASWSDVATKLGRTPDGGALANLRTRALRLGLEISHLEPAPPCSVDVPLANIKHLRSAAPMLAAAWFTVRAYSVSWPLEPPRYDLVAERGATYRRVQVKTTTWRDEGSYSVTLTNSRYRGRASYSAAEIDDYFAITGDLDGYLIPVSHVIGRQRLSLNAYAAFKVMVRGSVLARP